MNEGMIPFDRAAADQREIRRAQQRNTKIYHVITTESVVPATNPCNGWTTCLCQVYDYDSNGNLVDTGRSVTVRNHSLDADSPAGVYGQVRRHGRYYVFVWLDCTVPESKSSSGSG